MTEPTDAGQVDSVGVVELARAFARLSADAHELIGAGRPSLLTRLREATPIVVTGRHLEAALDELTDAGSALTRSLLGGSAPPPGPGPGPGPVPGLAPGPASGMPAAYGSDLGWSPA